MGAGGGGIGENGEGHRYNRRENPSGEPIPGFQRQPDGYCSNSGGSRASRAPRPSSPGQPALHSSLWRVVWKIKCLDEWEGLNCGGQSGNCNCG